MWTPLHSKLVRRIKYRLCHHGAGGVRGLAPAGRAAGVTLRVQVFNRSPRRGFSVPHDIVQPMH
jgi:hypothetical protein